MNEYIIENVSKEELDLLEKSDLEWYPDDLMGNDVCIHGTKQDAYKALIIIGRKYKEVH
ncbi:MAG: hypothetical protein IJT36_03800 [Alphaproteobacteria bacterium]|nr:hypothetical protein [Alphaproteobacteria bacterium]